MKTVVKESNAKKLVKITIIPNNNEITLPTCLLFLHNCFFYNPAFENICSVLFFETITLLAFTQSVDALLQGFTEEVTKRLLRLMLAKYQTSM